MIEQELTFQDLQIPSSEIYEAMGYKDSIPDQMVIDETNTLLKRIPPLLHPRFAFFFMEGVLDVEKETLSVLQSIHPPTVNPIQDSILTRNSEQNTFSTQSKSTVFSVGKTIARQLRGSEAFVFFAATAGTEFEKFQHTLQQEGDMVKIYIADSLGSIIAEKTADCMEVALAEYIREKNWKHTNRYSPGYCGWHVSEQQKLFPLFPVATPCGIRLTDSSLMVPIKSVSGVIGTGTNVRKLEYTCGLCTYENCYRKRKHR